MSTFTPVSEVEPSRVDVPRIAPWVFLSLKETECLDSGWAIERVTFTSLVDADSSVNDTSLTGTAFLTAAAFTPIFPRACSGGGGGGGSSSGVSAPQSKPLWKGKALMKYVVKFRPTKVKGKVVGDKGASAKLVITGVMYSSTLYYLRNRFRTLNVNSGGSIPTVGSGPSCTSPTTVSFAYSMINITSNKVGRRKHYNFKYLDELDHSCTVADLRAAVALLVSRLGKYPKVYHSKNLNALCGKVRKLV